MSKQIYHTVGNFPRSNKIVERGKIGAALTHKYTLHLIATLLLS